jgi:hypothetical protein
MNDKPKTLPTEPTDFVWGAAAIGAVIGTDARAAFRLLDKQLIPAVKVGRKWCSSRAALKAHFAPSNARAA